MVGLSMAYLTAVTFAIYLVSAFLLREAAGYPFSVLPAAAWIAALALVLFTIGWSTRSMVVLMLGWLVTLFAGGGMFVVSSVLTPPLPNDVDYPLTDYAVIALIGLVSFGVTVASVARQRRGDAQTAITLGLQAADCVGGSSTCSVSRVPPRLRRGLKCGWT